MPGWRPEGSRFSRPGSTCTSGSSSSDSYFFPSCGARRAFLESGCQRPPRSRQMQAIENEAPEYEAPEVVDYGDLIELTAAGGDGDCLDADYPIGTRRSALGFSAC